eukprot:7024564-Prymnesium_polylepis.1
MHSRHRDVVKAPSAATLSAQPRFGHAPLALAIEPHCLSPPKAGLHGAPHADKLPWAIDLCSAGPRHRAFPCYDRGLLKGHV